MIAIHCEVSDGNRILKKSFVAGCCSLLKHVQPSVILCRFNNNNNNYFYIVIIIIINVIIITMTMIIIIKIIIIFKIKYIFSRHRKNSK